MTEMEKTRKYEISLKSLSHDLLIPHMTHMTHPVTHMTHVTQPIEL